MALSQGSLSRGQSGSGIISLLLPETKDLYVGKNNVRFVVTPITFQIYDESLLKRIWSDLAEVFDSRSLKRLVEGTYCAQAQFVVAFWLWHIKADQSSAEWKLGHDVMMQCVAEIQGLPEEIATTAPYLIQRYALFSMSFCWIRVDQDDRSICSGNLAISAQFLFITQLHERAFRVWFREPSTAITARVFTMDLLASELPELNFRVHFTTSTDWPSLDTWPSVENSTKELVWRAIYQKGNNHLGALYDKGPESFAVPCNMHYQIPDKISTVSSMTLPS